MVRKWAWAAVWLVAAVVGTVWVQARDSATVPVAAVTTGVATTVALSELPPQGQEVMQLIWQGGPFPYDKDGTTFFNRERLLPLETRGFYREYTVPTPGLRHRGARRIVCGGPDAVRVKIVVA